VGEGGWGIFVLRTCARCYARLGCTPHRKASTFNLSRTCARNVSPGWHTLCIAKLHSFSVFRTRTPHLHTFCQAGMHSATQSFTLFIDPAPVHVCVARLAYTLHRKASLFFCLPHSHTALAHILPFNLSRTCARMCRQAGIHFASQSSTLFLSSALAHRTCTHFARQRSTPQHRASLYSMLPHLCTYVLPGWDT